MKQSSANDQSISAVVFATLWALAVFFSLSSNRDWFLGIQREPTNLRYLIEACMLVLVFLVIVKPQSLKVFLLLSLLQVMDVLIMLPKAPNHRLILLFGNLGILLSFVLMKIRPTDKISLYSLVQTTRPYLYSLVIILYFFAFLAKLNGAYLDPSISCASVFYGHVTEFFSFFPQGREFELFAIYSSLGVEGALLFLLGIRRLRPYGVLFGIIFHYALALDLIKHFIDFSGVMTALLVTFVPDGAFSKIRERFLLAKSSRYSRFLTLETLRVAFVTLFGISLGLGLVSNSSTAIYVRLVFARQIFYTLEVVLLLIFLLRYFKIHLEESKKNDSVPTFQLAHACIAGMLVINGLSPYLGIKTRTAFTMYSNLRIEPEVSNHIFMPKSPDLLGHMAETIEIEDTNNAYLRKEYLEPKLKLTFFEFRRLVSSDLFLEGEQVVYRCAGRTSIFQKGLHNISAPSWIQRKLLTYAAIGDGSEKICIW